MSSTSPPRRTIDSSPTGAALAPSSSRSASAIASRDAASASALETTVCGWKTNASTASARLPSPAITPIACSSRRSCMAVFEAVTADASVTIRFVTSDSRTRASAATGSPATATSQRSRRTPNAVPSSRVIRVDGVAEEPAPRGSVMSTEMARIACSRERPGPRSGSGPPASQPVRAPTRSRRRTAESVAWATPAVVVSHPATSTRASPSTARVPSLRLIGIRIAVRTPVGTGGPESSAVAADRARRVARSASPLTMIAVSARRTASSSTTPNTAWWVRPARAATPASGSRSSLAGSARPSTSPNAPIRARPSARSTSSPPSLSSLSSLSLIDGNSDSSSRHTSPASASSSTVSESGPSGVAVVMRSATLVCSAAATRHA